MSSRNEFAKLASMLEAQLLVYRDHRSVDSAPFLGAAELMIRVCDLLLKLHLLLPTNLDLVIKKTRCLVSIFRNSCLME